MRLAGVFLFTGAIALGVTASARADDSDPAYEPVRAGLDAAEEALFGAAEALVADDSAAALQALAQADVEAAGALAAAGGLRIGDEFRRNVADLRRRIARSERIVEGTSTNARPAVLSVRDAILAERRSVASLRGRGAPFTIRVAGASAAVVRGPGAKAVVRVEPAGCADSATATLSNDDPEGDALTLPPGASRPGRFAIVWGSSPGTARLTISACGAERTLRFLNLGRRHALAVAPPSGLEYPAVVFARVGRPVESPAPTLSGGPPFVFSVDPSLPEGLALNPATGALTGAPLSAVGLATTYRVTARNARGAVSADLVVDLDAALPEGVEDLADGFAISAVVRNAEFPAKLAVLADGRVLYSELLTGNVRVVSSAGVLDPAPVVTVPVLTGGERGLLGIAPSPGFAGNGALYVFASTAAGDGRPERNRVLRYVLSSGAATGPEVVVDDLPIGITQNGGALAFGSDGMLYVTVGDTGDANLAQDDGSLAGRVLRYRDDGSVPADNPIAGSPEWARGFRNPFGIAFQPSTGYLFATENGPTAHDELDYVLPGRNFEWGAPPDTAFGALRGIRLIDWTPVIVPTGIAVHPGPDLGDTRIGDLFVGSYDRAEVRRIHLDGIDVESEAVFVRFVEQGLDQKPLDLAVAPTTGALWISTFTTLWRVTAD